MQHRILGTVYTLLNENKKKFKKICAASFQILEDRQNRGCISEKVEAMRTLWNAQFTILPTGILNTTQEAATELKDSGLIFLGGKCFKVFKFAKLVHQKRDGEAEKTYKERKGVDTYTVYALWESLERSLSLKLSIILWFTAYTMGMWEKRVNCKAHNTRIFSIILRNAFLNNDITVLRKCWIWSLKFKRLKINY